HHVLPYSNPMGLMGLMGLMGALSLGFPGSLVPCLSVYLSYCLPVSLSFARCLAASNKTAAAAAATFNDSTGARNGIRKRSSQRSNNSSPTPLASAPKMTIVGRRQL